MSSGAAPARPVPGTGSSAPITICARRWTPPAKLSAARHFNIPEHGADRMGRDGPLYELAQWYPRLNVYDDLRGWNTEPYLGQGEFYLEYGDYTLDVTVPSGYIVTATGTLQNPRDV